MPIYWLFLLFQIVEQIDVIRIIEFEPLRDRRGRASAPRRQRGDNSCTQFRIENVTDPHHRLIVSTCGPVASEPL